MKVLYSKNRLVSNVRTIIAMLAFFSLFHIIPLHIDTNGAWLQEFSWEVVGIVAQLLILGALMAGPDIWRLYKREYRVGDGHGG